MTCRYSDNAVPEIIIGEEGTFYRRRRIAAKSLALLGIALLASSGHAKGANCFDLSKNEPRTLDGLIEGRIFPGSMSDVVNGRVSEPGFILKLDAPICIIGQDFADPATAFLEAEVRPTSATASAMRKLDGARVHLELSGPYAAMTVHDHRPLVATVESIVAVAGPGMEAGPGAAAVRAFYDALSVGRGERAAALIVPENRRGHFATEALSRFYGALRERLKLEFVLAQEPNSFLVRYKFSGRSDHCDGRAIVTTTMRGAATLIENIRALDGC